MSCIVVFQGPFLLGLLGNLSEDDIMVWAFFFMLKFLFSNRLLFSFEADFVLVQICLHLLLLPRLFCGYPTVVHVLDIRHYSLVSVFHHCQLV